MKISRRKFFGVLAGLPVVAFCVVSPPKKQRRFIVEASDRPDVVRSKVLYYEADEAEMIYCHDEHMSIPAKPVLIKCP